MIFEKIRNYLGQQNFALTATNSREMCILRNQSGSRAVFCVIIDNTMYRVFSAAQISSIQSQLEGMTENITSFSGCDVLFMVITNNVDRDISITQQPGCRVWLINAPMRQLLVYENQAYDFYGMRAGVEASIAAPQRGRDDQADIRYTAAHGSADRQQGSAPGNSFNRANVPVATIVLIAVNVIWYIVLAAMGSTTDSNYMVQMGGNVGYLIFREFQVWRLLTSMFMHFGIMHLASNMVYLGFIGYNLERNIGHLKFLLIYMLSGIGAGVVSAGYYYLTDISTVSAGASGAIYGVIGTMIYLMLRNRAALRSGYAFMRIGIALVFIFYSSVLNSTVDGAAHIGGFIIGFILSFLFLKDRRRQ